MVSIQIAGHFLGRSWVAKNIGFLNEPAAGYFSRKDFLSHGMRQAEEHLDKVIDLGGMLYNLQGAEGFGSVVSHMKTEKNIETVRAEIEAAALLHCYGIPFRFNVPVLRKGADYDLEVFTPEGEWVCAEVKCKVDSLQAKASRVCDIIKKAQKQLPSDRASLVFLRIPLDWVLTGETLNSANDKEVAEGVLAALRNTKPVVGVIAYTRWVYHMTPEFDRVSYILHEHVNSSFKNPILTSKIGTGWKLFGERSAPVTRWVSIPQVISDGTFKPGPQQVFKPSNN